MKEPRKHAGNKNGLDLFVFVPPEGESPLSSGANRKQGLRSVLGEEALCFSTLECSANPFFYVIGQKLHLLAFWLPQLFLVSLIH